MLVIPAIDIRHGQCVRLYQGKDDQVTVYSKNVMETAELWVSKGAKRLHIADLDGAFEGKPINLALASEIQKRLQVPVQIGGGYRTIESIRAALEAGVDRVILGTVAVYNPDLVQQAVEDYGSSVAVSIDVADDFVAVAGWREVSSIRFDDLVQRMQSLGVKELLFTDTRKDGTLSGPNLPAIKIFLSAANVPVIVSGGITTLEDVQTLKELESLGLKGIVIGKALYDKHIALDEAIRIGGLRA